MMRGESGAVAMAVRDSKGNIIVETERLGKPSGARKIPFVRGFLNLVDSMKNGMRYMMKAAESGRATRKRSTKPKSDPRAFSE